MQTRAPGLGRSCRYDRCEGTAILLTVYSSGTAVDLPPQRPFVILLPPVAVVVYPRPPAGGPHGRSTAVLPATSHCAPQSPPEPPWRLASRHYRSPV